MRVGFILIHWNYS